MARRSFASSTPSPEARKRKWMAVKRLGASARRSPATSMRSVASVARIFSRMSTTSMPLQDAAASSSCSGGDGPSSPWPSLTACGPPATPPRNACPPSQRHRHALRRVAGHADAPWLSAHGPTLDAAPPGSSPRSRTGRRRPWPTRRPEQLRVEQEGHQRRPVGPSVTALPPARAGIDAGRPRTVTTMNATVATTSLSSNPAISYHASRPDAATTPNAATMKSLSVTGSTNTPSRDGPSRRAIQPSTRSDAAARAQDDEARVPVRQQHERHAEGHAERRQHVGHAPLRSCLLASGARASFGHTPPLRACGAHAAPSAPGIRPSRRNIHDGACRPFRLTHARYRGDSLWRTRSAPAPHHAVGAEGDAARRPEAAALLGARRGGRRGPAARRARGEPAQAGGGSGGAPVPGPARPRVHSTAGLPRTR